MVLWILFALYVGLVTYAVDDRLVKLVVVKKSIIKSHKEEVTCDRKEIEMLDRMDDETFKQAFINTLDMRQKLLYLRTMDIESYEKFLDRFNNNEDAWKKFREQLPQEEKRHIPESLLVQHVMVRDAYYKYSPGSWLAFLDPAKTENPLQDLAYWRLRFYMDGFLYNSDVELKLDNEFRRQKYRLLKLEV